MAAGRFTVGPPIAYTTFEHDTLSTVLVAKNGPLITAVCFADDTKKAVSWLAQQFLGRRLVSLTDDEAEELADRVRPYLEPVPRHAGLPPAGHQPRPPVPANMLDLDGTQFQRRVWEAISTIPPGETRSYGEIAQLLGTKAVRAVASACAVNRIALLVPCHRVVGRNGQLTGYQWGVERKAALLVAEGATAWRK